MAPGTIEVAAFGKNNNADAWPVVNGVALNIEYVRMVHIGKNLTGFENLLGLNY